MPTSHKTFFYKIFTAFVAVMIALAVLPVTPAYAAACNATVTGNWNTIATWSCGHVPTSADDVTINATRTVSFDAAATSTVLSLTVNGTLNFNIASGNSLTVSGNVTNAGAIAVVNQIGTNAHVLSVGGNFTNNGTFTSFSSNDSLNVVLNGTAAQSIGGTTATIFNNLTISNTTAAVTATNNFSLNSTMTVNNGATFNVSTFVVSDNNNSQFTLSSGATLGIGSTAGISSTCGSGNIQTNSCTYSAGANYVYNGAANQNTGSGLPNNLTGTVTIKNPGFTVTLNNGKTIASGGTVNIVAGTFAAGTNLTMATTSNITRSGGSMTGTPQGNGVYNVTYTGNSMTTSTELAGNGLNNVTVNLTAGQTLTLDQNRAPDGNLSISSGTFDLSTFTINRSAAGGTLTVSNGAALKIGGTNGFPTNYNTHTLGATSTVEYAGTNQNVSAETYGNLIFSASGLKSMVAGTSVGGNLSIAPSGTAKASVGNGLNLTVNSLTLGGLGKISGTWGSTISPATHQDNTYFNVATTGILTVTTDSRATPSVTTWPTASGITYPQALSASTLTGGSASVAGSFAFTTPATTPSAGTYSASVTFTPTDATSYKTVTGNVNVAVAKATPTATLAVNNSPVTYDGSPHSATVAISVSSVPGSASNILTGGAATQTSANTYAVTADFVPTDTTNYNTLTGLSAGNFTIGQASSTVTVTCTAGAPYTYTGSAQTPCTAQATGAGMSPVDVSASLIYSNNINAGAATANASWGGDANHTGNTGSGGFTIGQASSTVTVTCTAGAPYTYTGSAQTPCTAEATGAGMSPVDVSASLVYSNNINAGAATVDGNWGGDANHSSSNGSGGFTIGQASSSVTVSCPASVIYTGSAQTPCTAEATGAGMSPVNVSVSLVYSNNIDAGAATADASWGGDANHTGNTGSGGFTIGQATSSVTISCPASVIYTGSGLTPCTASYLTSDGLSGPLTPTYSNNTNVGTATPMQRMPGTLITQAAATPPPLPSVRPLPL